MLSCGAPQVARRAADDEPDEEVEEDEERDLEREQRLVGVDASAHWSDAAEDDVGRADGDPVAVVSACGARPGARSAPCRSSSRGRRRSSTSGRPARSRSAGARRWCRRRGRRTRASGRARRARRDRVDAVADRERHDLALPGGGAAPARARLERRAGRYTMVAAGTRAIAGGRRRRRRPERCLDRRGSGARAGAGQAPSSAARPCRDAELADREVVVGRGHARRREQRVALTPRVLGEVLLQLADQRPLVRENCSRSPGER